MKTTQEIHEKIQDCCNMSLEASCGRYLAIMEEMNNNIAALEKRIEELESRPPRIFQYGYKP